MAVMMRKLNACRAGDARAAALGCDPNSTERDCLAAPICALEVPSDEDLSALTRVLWRDALPHRVVFSGGLQRVLVADAAAAERVRSLYLLGPVQPLPGLPLAPSRAVVVWQTLWLQPATATIVLVALLLAPVGIFSGPLTAALLAALTFTKVSVLQGHTQIDSFAQMFASGQWWRFITPSWLHFSFLHIAADAVLFWEFGRRIEARLGSWFMVLLFVSASVVANSIQYWSQPDAIFGGLSGVVTAELGFSMTVGRSRGFSELLPNPVFAGAMLVSLLIFSTGVTAHFGLNIANGAHWAGLGAGVALGGGVLFVARRAR